MSIKKYIIPFFVLLTIHSFSQSMKPGNNTKNNAFIHGEWLKYRMSYSNFLYAGYSTLEVREGREKGRETFHVNGHGKTTGIISLFFKVRDNYQTFMYQDNLKPYRFIRKIDEGGYTKDKEIFFDYDKNEALVKDYKEHSQGTFPIENNIQDMLSSLYYLRNQQLDNLKEGDEIELNMFFDEKTNKFKLRYLGKEIIDTKFGKVRTLVFMPFVEAGRVFKAQESVTFWVSDDGNKIPLRIKAALAVGSLRADLDEFKGLAHPFNIIFDK